MNIHFKILFTFLLQALSFNMLAQFNYTAQAQQAQNAILNLDFAAYNSLKQKHTEEENGIYFWLDAYMEFVAYQTNSKKNDFESVIAKIKNNISSIESFKPNTAFYYYSLTDLHLFLCFLYLMNEEPFHSFQQYVNAKSLIKNYQKKFPDFEFGGKHKLVQLLVNNIVDEQFGLSSESYSEIQESYIKLLGKNLQTQNNVYQRELKLLGVLLFDFYSEANFSSLINEVHIDSNFACKGPLEAFSSSLIYKKADRYSEQLSILKKADELGFDKKLNSLNMYYGIALLNQQNDSAINYIDDFLVNQHNSEYIQYAQFKASMYWYVNDGIPTSNKLNQQILQTHVHATDEDKQAFYEIGHTNSWTRELILARLLFDGGEYKEALAVLLANKDKVSSYTKQQKLEYSYRIGRIYDKFDEVEKAEKFYLMVINSGLDAAYYYPAYAAYYLGNIFKKINNRTKAEFYYNKCLELNSPIYKSSIHKKARQAINN